MLEEIKYAGENTIRAIIEETKNEFNKRSYVPNATSDDDGMLLSVVDGDPAWISAPSGVLYTEQSLTDEQKAQARANIGAKSGSAIYEKEKEVYCYPMAGSDLNVVSHITPVYETNIKNLLPASLYNYEWAGIAYTWNSDVSLSITGTTTSENSTYLLVSNETPLTLKDGLHTFSIGTTLPTGVSIIADAYEDAANWIGFSRENSFTLSGDDMVTFTASSEHEYSFMLKVDAGCTVDLKIYPQLEAGEYATEYVPYTSTPGTPQATRSISLSIENDVETKQYDVAFERDVYNGKYDWNSGILTDLDSGAEYTYTPQEIKALDGLNIITSDADAIEVAGVTLDVNSAKMREYNHIAQLYLYGDTSAMTKDNPVVLRFKYMGADNYINASHEGGLRESGKQRGGWVKVKWQGSSSIAYPKKNYSLTFCSDDAGENKRGIPFRSNWGSQSKYCAKANFIDPTHCRNVVAAKLWGECVQSRNTESESYIRMHDLPNAGAIDGYPMLIFINDKYQGIYTMNIAKTDWMFGMKDGEGMNTVLCGENYSESTTFYGAPVIDDTDWSYEVEPADKSWVLGSFGAIYTAITMSESTEEEIAAKKAALENCVDIYSVIDYGIFLEELGVSDNHGKNQLMATYDGTKWIISAYDLDTAFGNHWSGTRYHRADGEYSNGLIWIVRHLYPAEYVARKEELKNGCLGMANILDKLANFIIDVPQEAFRAEAEIWPDMCGSNSGSIQQIQSFINERHKPTADEVGAVSYSAQSLTDEQKAQARTNIGAGTSDVTSWNNLLDKPFGELPTGSDTLYWDGNREGLTRAVDYEQYLISESTPTIDDFANGASNTKLDGDTETSTNLGLHTAIYEIGDGAIVVGNSIVALKDGATVGDTIYPKKGTYFTWIGNDSYTTSLTIPGYDGFPSSKLLDEKWLPKHTHQIGPVSVTTAGSGAAYTATVDGITALTAGISFTMIPHTTSTSKTATLNVNGLGAKMLRRPVSSNNTSTVANTVDNWMYANKPVEVMYNGTYWIVISMPRPNGPDIYGTVPVSAGGVPSATSDDEGKFLRVVDGTAAWVAISSAEEASF